MTNLNKRKRGFKAHSSSLTELVNGKIDQSYVIVRVKGNVDLSSAEQFMFDVHCQTLGYSKDLILDVPQNVRFDSCGIAILKSFLDNYRNRKVSICGEGDKMGMESYAETLGLDDKRFRVYKTLDEALEQSTKKSEKQCATTS